MLYIIVDTTDMVAVVIDLCMDRTVARVVVQRRLVAHVVVEEEVEEEEVLDPAVLGSDMGEEVHIPHKAPQHKMAAWCSTLCQKVDREVDYEVEVEEEVIEQNDAAIGSALLAKISVEAGIEDERSCSLDAWKVPHDLLRDELSHAMIQIHRMASHVLPVGELGEAHGQVEYGCLPRVYSAKTDVWSALFVMRY